MKFLNTTAMTLVMAVAANATLADASKDAELEALKSRVEALENRDTTQLNLGDGTTVDIYGYVKFDAFYDFDFNQGDTAFVNAIGEPENATSGNFGSTLRQTRLGFRSTSSTSIGEIKGQLEFDLFASGGTSELRLRHANIKINDTWTFGQDWTNFMPLNHYPTTVEFNGPVGITFARQAQVRYTGRVGNEFEYSFSLEENAVSSNDPVVTGAASYTTDRFSARISGLVGTVRSGGEEEDQYGVTLSGSVSPWEGGLFQATYTTGEGLGAYLIGFGDPIVGGQANEVDAYTIEFRQQVGNHWNFGISYGREEYDQATSTGTLDFTDLQTVHVNAFYSPTDDLTFGAEYIFAERESSSGDTIDADRVQLSAQFNF